MDVLENLFERWNSLPTKEDYTIIITKLLPHVYKAEYEGKKYFIINRIEWLKLENDLRTTRLNIENETLFPQGYFGTFYSIPVIEDEELVKRIFQIKLSTVGI